MLDVRQGSRGFSFGSPRFLFERWPEIVVGLVQLIILFRVGLEQLFVGVALLGSPVGLS